MKAFVSMLLWGLATGTAFAQAYPPNEAGATMGHSRPDGCKLAFIKDPWGTSIELNERSKPL